MMCKGIVLNKAHGNKNRALLDFVMPHGSLLLFLISTYTYITSRLEINPLFGFSWFFFCVCTTAVFAISSEDLSRK